MQKNDSRKISAEERFVKRKLSVRLKKLGKTHREIAEIIGVREATISSWINSYKKGGIKALKEKKRGAESEDRKFLSNVQELEIQKMITDTMPDQFKLSYGLWTRRAVKELVEREFGIVLAVSTIGKYLRKWGFSPQKPKKRAYEQNSKLVQKWIDEEYPAIEKRAKEENAVIHWGDETGSRNTTNHGRSYAPKGKTPVKKNMAKGGKRFSVNMISTVTNLGQVEFMIYSGTMNSDRLIEFMKGLIKGKKRKVFLILDNLRVHHSKIVKAWCDENKNKIELFYLPSYSPEKNPDEYLNCDLKYGLSEKPSPKNESELRNNIENHMLMLQGNTERVNRN
jgi:transposase